VSLAGFLAQLPLAEPPAASGDGGFEGEADHADGVDVGELGDDKRPRAHVQADQPQRLSLRFKPVGMLGAHQPRSAGVEAGWAGQAALVVLGRFFLGFLVGFLIAGWRTAGPEGRPLGRPGERPEGFGAAAGDPTAHSRRENPLRTR
jgi:hypothetical protein